MNINSKAFAKPKMTKRQRKLMNGPNDAVKISLSEGVLKGDYVGANPVFAMRNFKVEGGVPFVRPKNFGVAL